MALPDQLPSDFNELEKAIARHEALSYPLKQGAEARIKWYDEKKEKTPYSLVYLHGFKGSHPEAHPVHQTIADNFGCNLYLSRLYGHGQITAGRFEHLTTDKLIQSAEDAFRIGKQIGERVILMGSSTGGTLACHLAAQSSKKQDIAALLLYSPLVHLYGMHSLLLENSWSRRLLEVIAGRDYLVRSGDPFSPDESKIWYRSYRLTGALVLGQLVQELITPALFRQITCPAFVAYYYKNRHNHDRIVSTSAIKRMAKKLGTAAKKREIRNFPNANSHVLCNSLLSNAVQDVIYFSEQFLELKSGIKRVSAKQKT